ncbi:MAP kinase-activating death domain protein-like, partial [Lingula anatina]|uniref:MAP kinase-activating death domain protein n=1 Tax=Lingula anatina TaxID=7574 RepID=A0A2R2MTX4_LINAN
VDILPPEMSAPMVFALPDHTRFSLVDFPLHLPLELLGVETCLKVLACIILENKIILQSRDYNALTMSVIAFVSMLYPLEYMFPVIPLLPTCMGSAEQLLLAPTPYIIGVPASFLLYKRDFQLPDDVWLVDLDSNKVKVPSGCDDLPPFPEPEGSLLKNHLKQALASMSMTPQPIKNLETLAQNPELWPRRESFNSSNTGFNPFIYGNDVDSVDIATRVAMVRFFNSPNLLGNFSEHTRTLRLYPRPVVAFQISSFVKSRPTRTTFAIRLARTQAVEYFAEFYLNPTNMVFLRVQTGVFDPSLIGDKPKWYSKQLQEVQFRVYDNTSSLGMALTAAERAQEEDPTDESGSDSDGGGSSSSYSSLSDFVIDMVNSEINGETPEVFDVDSITKDTSYVYAPPRELQVPEPLICPTDSSSSEDSEMDSDSSSGPLQYASDMDKTNSQAGSQVDSPGNDLDSPGSVFDSVPPPNGSIPGQAISPKPRIESKVLVPISRSSSDSAYSGSTNSTGQASSQRGRISSDSTTVINRSGGGDSPHIAQSQSSFAARGLSLKGDGQGDNKESIISSLGSEINGYAKQASSTLSELFDQSKEGLSSTVTGLKHGLEKKQLDKIKLDDLKQGLAGTVESLGHGMKEVKKGVLEMKEEVQSAPIGSQLESVTSAVYSKGSTYVKELRGTKSTTMNSSSKQTKPYAPLGNRKALVEKSGLVKHASHRKMTRDSSKQQLVDTRTSAHSENQQFLKDAVSHILDGHGVGWLKINKIRRLMEDENYRNFVVSRLNTSLDKKLTEEDMYIEDVCVSKQIFKGMLTMLKAIVYGLDFTYRNHGIGGMASAFMVCEIIHTHYWAKELTGSNRSDASGSQTSSPFGSRESLVSDISPRVESKSLPGEDQSIPVLGGYFDRSTSPRHSAIQRELSPSHSLPSSYSAGSPVLLDGEEYQNIELKNSHPLSHTESGKQDYNSNSAKSHYSTEQHTTSMRAVSAQQTNCDIIVTDTDPLRRQYVDTDPLRGPHAPDTATTPEKRPSQQEDILRELVKNKELLRSRRGVVPHGQSVDSEVSEGSTLVSDGSDWEGRRPRINHQTIKPSLSDSSEHDIGGLVGTRLSRTASIWSNKSTLSGGFRFRDGKLVHVGPLSPTTTRLYLFQHLIDKDRSRLWDQMQFWEDVFLDAVAQERDIIGMDQGPAEMMDRYKDLGAAEKKRLEQDEDRLLANMLYNLIAFMVMMKVNKQEIRRKARRMLGKCHIGLHYSQEINELLDNLTNLHGNDIDLKPLGSRMMQKQSFTVHWGPDNTGDMLFMEVCDDCIVLRSVMGIICDRWWYEKLVNMTYCPKTKVLCLWRKNGDQTQLNKFYTKKCKELYFCVRESMEKAALRNNGKIPGPELGGEFPVQDLKTGQGGLLQVCMEGIGLLLESSKDFEFFVELNRVRKCFTQKGGIFVLEEFDAKNKKVIQRKYKSSMADDICYAVLCVFSYVAAGMEQQQQQQQKQPQKQQRESTRESMHSKRPSSDSQQPDYILQRELPVTG